MTFKILQIATVSILLSGCAHDYSTHKNNAASTVDEQRQAVTKPTGWTPTVWNIPLGNVDVKFHAPALLNEKVIDQNERYYRLARYQRFTVSLNFAAPNCTGSFSSQSHMDCLIKKIKRNPYTQIDEKTISQIAHKDGRILTYVSIVGAGQHRMKVINTHLVFEQDGRWGDFYASLLQPNHGEFLHMLSFASSVSLHPVIQP